jgi:ATP-dependent protease ClpP protease subunit
MAEIWLNGYVGYDLTPKTVSEMLQPLFGADVIINLNTPGGSVYDGVEIYNILRQYAGKKTIRMGSLVASIGSYIAAAGDVIIAQDFTSYMIHNVRSFVDGDSDEMAKEAERLKRLNEQIANRLSDLSGQTVAAILEQMKNTTWLYGKEISDAGFATDYEDTGKSVDRNMAIMSAEHQYMRSVAMIKNKNYKDESPGVAGDKKLNGGKSMETKAEVLERSKALFDNGKLTLKEFADAVGANDLIVTDQHREALKVRNAITSAGYADPLATIAAQQARIDELSKAERAVALTNAFGPEGETNLVREYAEKIVPKNAVAAELAAAIESVKADKIAKNLMGEMVDPASAVNRLESNETEGTGKYQFAD